MCKRQVRHWLCMVRGDAQLGWAIDIHGLGWRMVLLRVLGCLFVQRFVYNRM